MARPTEGWHFRKKRNPDNPNEILSIYFTLDKKLVERSTGHSDPAKARAEAARLYAEALAGNLKKPTAPQINNTTPMEVAVSTYLDAMEKNKRLKPRTIEWRENVAAHHLVPFFPRLCDVTDEKCEEYMNKRLGEVQRRTVRSEISFLWRVLIHAKVPLPKRPRLDPKVMGTKSTKRYRAAPLQPSEFEIRKVLKHLPEFTKRAAKAGMERMRVRDFFAFMYAANGIRPATICRLMVPDHWRPDVPHELTIAPEIDKCGYGSKPNEDPVVPLTKEAQAILKRVVGKRTGRFHIFGYEHATQTRWRYWKEAAIAAKVPRAELWKPYDIRHGAAVRLLDVTGDIRATGFLLRHRLMTTTDGYSKANREAGNRGVAKLDSLGGSLETRRGASKKSGKKAA